MSQPLQSNGKTIVDLQKEEFVKSRRKSAGMDAKEFEELNNGEKSWQDSKDVKRCTKCTAKFTLTNRKHHCRYVFTTNHCRECIDQRFSGNVEMYFVASVRRMKLLSVGY